MGCKGGKTRLLGLTVPAKFLAAVDAIGAALEAAGVVVIAENGGGARGKASRTRAP